MLCTVVTHAGSALLVKALQAKHALCLISRPSPWLRLHSMQDIIKHMSQVRMPLSHDVPHCMPGTSNTPSGDQACCCAGGQAASRRSASVWRPSRCRALTAGQQQSQGPSSVAEPASGPSAAASRGQRSTSPKRATSTPRRRDQNGEERCQWAAYSVLWLITAL